MTIHAVDLQALKDAKAAAQDRARNILDNVNVVQGRLARTDFIGDNADELEQEMNDKMEKFVVASYENVDELMRVVNNNVLVVVTKLGGHDAGEWSHVPLARTAADRAKAQTGSNSYLIDTDEMGTFAADVTDSFQGIADSYEMFRTVVVEQTPGWVGPEKDATRAAIDNALPQIIGVEGGTGVKGVGSSLSDWILEQARIMGGGDAAATSIGNIQ